METKKNPFSEKTIKFLLDLQRNNNKKWFEKNRNRYELELLQPFKALVEILAPAMHSIDEDFETRPAVNKTISRIHRDIRFSKDKSPYKSNMWLSFKIPSKDWKQMPVFFFELMPPVYRYGMGFYKAEKSTMDYLRRCIDDQRPDILSLVEIFNQQKQFLIQGDDYKRNLNKDLSSALSQWYQKKSIFMVCNQKIGKQFYQDKLITDIENGFEFLTPFYHYFWNLRV